jgi:hypothetical protein
MDSLIQLASQMNWPFAFAVIGVAGAFAIPIIVRRVSRTRLELEQMGGEERLRLAEVRTSVRNGLVEQ